MPEIDVFMSCGDETDLVSYILGKGGVLVPDVEYDEPVPLEISDLEHFRAIRRKESLFFVLNESYAESSLGFDSLEREDNGVKYFITQRNGGPTVDLLCSAQYTKNGFGHTSAGSVSYYPTYWSTRGERNMKAPAALVAFYRSLISFLRQGSIEIGPSDRRYLICRGVIERLRQGARLGHPFEGMPMRELGL